MKGEHLGELEELVMLAIGAMDKAAYSVNILELLKEETERTPDVTAVHAVLRRLESKGFVTSAMGGVTAERGGRRKRFFKLTNKGRKVLDETMIARMNLYKRMLTLTVNEN